MNCSRLIGSHCFSCKNCILQYISAQSCPIFRDPGSPPDKKEGGWLVWPVPTAEGLFLADIPCSHTPLYPVRWTITGREPWVSGTQWIDVTRLWGSLTSDPPRPVRSAWPRDTQPQRGASQEFSSSRLGRMLKSLVCFLGKLLTVDCCISPFTHSFLQTRATYEAYA